MNNVHPRLLVNDNHKIDTRLLTAIYTEQWWSIWFISDKHEHWQVETSLSLYRVRRLLRVHVLFS